MKLIENIESLKILYAPYNIASQPSITIEAFKRIPGIIPKGVAIMSSKFIDFGEDQPNTWKVFNIYGPSKNFINLFKNWILAEFYLCKYIIWADIIIWQWDTRIILPHFWFLKFSKKPIIVEWLGSDIRIPELIFKFNSFYEKEYKNKTYTYLKESKARSRFIQKKFKFLNASPYLAPEMSLFIDKLLFPDIKILYQRICVAGIDPNYPSIHNNVITIVHTPSSTGAKGTQFVREVINKLGQRYSINYLEVINKSQKESFMSISKADIFLDQFILGSYGMATCEALALGKPVFCYLMEPIVKMLPSDCPIVNSNPDNLEYKLIEFLNNPSLRYETGVRSRIYAEKYHDSDKIAHQLVQDFKKLLKR